MATLGLGEILKNLILPIKAPDFLNVMWMLHAGVAGASMVCQGGVIRRVDVLRITYRLLYEKCLILKGRGLKKKTL